MTAMEVISLLQGVRTYGGDRWIAQCPAHEDRSPSLTIRQTSDRLLIYCWAGCASADICAAVGIGLADLFSNKTQSRPDPIALRRRRAAEGLEQWRQRELRRLAGELRGRDTIIQYITEAVGAGTMTENEAIVALADEYHDYSDLEYRFALLLQGKETLQMWRETRRAA